MFDSWGRCLRGGNGFPSEPSEIKTVRHSTWKSSQIHGIFIYLINAGFQGGRWTPSESAEIQTVRYSAWLRIVRIFDGLQGGETDLSASAEIQTVRLCLEIAVVNQWNLRIFD